MHGHVSGNGNMMIARAAALFGMRCLGPDLGGAQDPRGAVK